MLRIVFENEDRSNDVAEDKVDEATYAGVDSTMKEGVDIREEQQSQW